jgi:adenylyl- and sulfurtransferase ThiI
MDINILQNAINEIEKNVKILENSKYEKNRVLVRNGRQIKLTLLNEDLKNLFGLEDLQSVERFANSDDFSKNKKIRVFEFNGGFILLR